MQPGQLVTAQDIEAMLKAQGLERRGLVAGDVLYIYTGWGDNWKDPDTEKFYYTKGPGLSYDAAKYIEQKAVVLVALDNPFTDPVAEGFLEGKAPPPPGTPAGLPFAIHHHNLTVAGIHNIQNANLGALRQGQGLAVLHHHPAAADAGRVRLAGAAGRDRGAGAAVATAARFALPPVAASRRPSAWPRRPMSSSWSVHADPAVRHRAVDAALEVAVARVDEIDASNVPLAGTLLPGERR